VWRWITPATWPTTSIIDYRLAVETEARVKPDVLAGRFCDLEQPGIAVLEKTTP
jgi:hypothetical protein